MKNKKMVAIVMAFLLSVSLVGASLAEDTAFSTVEVNFNQVVATAEATAAPVIDALAPTEAPVVVDSTTSSDPSTEPDITATAESTATVDPTVQPEASETPAMETATPELTATPTLVNRSVLINMDVPADLKLGDTVTLTATLVGYDGLNVSLQWQYSKDGEQWTDATGAGSNELVYAFQVSDETANTAWRLGVTIQ